jgi:hypothetical protein
MFVALGRGVDLERALSAAECTYRQVNVARSGLSVLRSKLGCRFIGGQNRTGKLETAILASILTSLGDAS